MDTFFREKLAVDVDYLNPFVNVPVSERIDGERITADLPRLGEVVGISLRRLLTCPVEINLMPPDLVARKVFRRRQPFFALTGVGVVLIMLCWWAYFHHMRGVLAVQSELVEKKVSELATVHGRMRGAVEEKKASRDRIDSVMKVVARRTVWQEMLDAVHGCMPDGMWLTGVKPVISQEGEITDIEVSGSGFVDKLVDKAEISAVEEFRDRLKTTEYFGDKTQIKGLPPVGSEAYAREFVLWLALEEPMKVR